MPAFIDLTGKRFHRRVVVELLSRGDKRGPLWKVQCDCGKGQMLRSGNITRNYSCGCYCKERIHTALAKPFGESSKNNLFVRVRASAKHKGLEFSLTIQDCEKIWKSNCHYCDVPPLQVARNKQKRFNGEYLFNGIDRKDNQKGYIDGNCLPCCKMCNYMKKAHSYEGFVAHILRMAEQLTKEKPLACAS